jgi:hypothetical protein
LTTPDDAAPRRPRGRPEGSTSPDTRKGSLKIRLNDEERKKIDQFAEDANLHPSDYVRRRALKQKLK